MSDSKKDKKDLTYKNGQDNFRLAFSPFLKNDHYTFVVQKTEKLASALYLVTGFIPENDPLRTRLRTCALDLVSTSTDPEKARNVRYHEGFASRCLEIGSILNLAERAGFISGMNARILCDEYAELASFVKDNQERIFRGNVVDANGKTFSPHLKRSQLNIQVASFDHQKDRNKKYVSKKTPNVKRHLNRRESILCLLDKKDKITIKDAVKSIEGCSEKTIQREMASMVQDGVLLKEGERRWSTYRKAQ